MFYFLGVDLGGSSKTYALALKEERKKVKLIKALSLTEKKIKALSLKEIEIFTKENRVLGCAIDAPLSFSPSIEKGLRKSDQSLRSLLPKKAQGWVLSYHTLMGIPIRGYLLAQNLSPFCGALLKTHPRASFYFLLPEEKRAITFKYKKEALTLEEKTFLSELFSSQFSLEVPLPIFEHPDSLDALICALTVYFYFKNPEKLLFLPQEEELQGFGPFVIIKDLKG